MSDPAGADRPEMMPNDKETRSPGPPEGVARCPSHNELAEVGLGQSYTDE
jgi:hypothetical protein